MAEELRALHDRMGATTVYVTHDQLEAMQMGDKIVVMNHGVVEQFGTPQDIYDHPATLFVAEFIGSPPMNQLAFEGGFAPGATQVQLGGATISVPALRQGADARRLVLGVRPEHVAISDVGAYRGRILATEYLGTTQIVTLDTDHGPVKARIPSSRVVRTGDAVGLTFNPATLSLFDAATGQAFRTAANEGVLAHG
jgi:multiple sugar transport system ATP-binding protein